MICLPARAQQSLGNLTGSLTDAQGSAIPNARIEVRNVETAVVTNYAITADAAGFKKLIVPALRSSRRSMHPSDESSSRSRGASAKLQPTEPLPCGADLG